MEMHKFIIHIPGTVLIDLNIENVMNVNISEMMDNTFPMSVKMPLVISFARSCTGEVSSTATS